jgi:hypothetical protein
VVEDAEGADDVVVHDLDEEQLWFRRERHRFVCLDDQPVDGGARLGEVEVVTLDRRVLRKDR